MVVEETAFEEGIRENRETFLRRIQAFPGGCLLLISEEGRTPIGYFCGELWERFDPPFTPERFTLGHSALESHSSVGTVLYISSMGLLPSYRGGGLGGLLFNGSVEYILSRNPRIEKAVLLVNERWEGAYCIYSKAGFAEIGRLKDFFTPQGASGNTPSDGIIMEKKR
jgi:ribosomal-protein-alanine N-acetyltransferase